MSLRLEDVVNIGKSDLFTDANRKKLMKFEAEKGHSIRNIPWSKFLTYRNNRVESTGIDPSLVAQKVMAHVIEAENYVPLWNQACSVQYMDAPIEEAPVIAYSDFKVYKGRTGTKTRRAGGFFSGIELNCKDERGMHRVDVALKKSWIKQNKWSALERALTAAGQSMYDEVLGSVITELETDVDSTTMTDDVANWGNNHYKALVKMLSLIAAKKMIADKVFINPSEIYDLGILDYFVHANYTALAGKQTIKPSVGLLGYLFPNMGIPIYWTTKVTSASMIMTSSQISAVLGIYQDMTIENFNDVINGEEGGVISMQWDVKSGKDATPSHNAKYGWAVATSA